MKTIVGSTMALIFAAGFLRGAEPEKTESGSCCDHFASGVILVADQKDPREFDWGDGTKVLIVGGHASHDFERWFNQEDTKTLEKDPPISVHYTDRPADILPALDDIDVLYLSLNQPIEDRKIHKEIEKFTSRGGGLVIVHAAIWNNWNNWPNYYKNLVGGYSQGHDPLGEFEVKVVKTDHPLTKGLPERFKITDELYYHHVDPKGAEIEVLAEATSEKEGKTFPSVWTVKHPKAKIVCITLGHDGSSHELDEFQTLLRRSVKWVTPTKKL